MIISFSTTILLNSFFFLPTMAKKSKKEVKKEEDEVYPEEEHDEPEDEKDLHMKIGEDDEDIYEEEGQKALTENDELEPWEEGFVEGAAGMGQLGKDALTGKPLMDADEVVEMELDGKLYRFANAKNAEKFREKRKKKK